VSAAKTTITTIHCLCVQYKQHIGRSTNKTESKKYYDR